MTISKQERRDTLLPGGIPKHLAIFDLPGYVDRYTVCFIGHYADRPIGEAQCVLLSENPRHPSHGFCIHDTLANHLYCQTGSWGPPSIGRVHPVLGKRIRFEDLPRDCQEIVFEDYLDHWRFKSPRPELPAL